MAVRARYVHRVQSMVDDATNIYLRERADAAGTSLSEVIRSIIDERIEEEPGPVVPRRGDLALD